MKSKADGVWHCGLMNCFKGVKQPEEEETCVLLERGAAGCCVTLLKKKIAAAKSLMRLRFSLLLKPWSSSSSRPHSSCDRPDFHCSFQLTNKHTATLHCITSEEESQLLERLMGTDKANHFDSCRWQLSGCGQGQSGGTEGIAQWHGVTFPFNTHVGPLLRITHTHSNMGYIP